ncbi:hypothetical protein JW978_02725 [Candidatus Dojkabacteria bacterium]|nr:hypothetical protein [Candidatus Dojkabacteria bacterium]
MINPHFNVLENQYHKKGGENAMTIAGNTPDAPIPTPRQDKVRPLHSRLTSHQHAEICARANARGESYAPDYVVEWHQQRPDWENNSDIIEPLPQVDDCEQTGPAIEC